MALDLTHIITKGSLKTYFVGTSFIEIYWTHSGLQEGQLYLFTFTTGKLVFIDCKMVNPTYLPRKVNPKKMTPTMLALVHGLRPENNR